MALVLQSTDVERSLPLTVRETVQMARYPNLGLLRRCRPKDRAAVDQALERVDMRDREEPDTGASGGQRQRRSLPRASRRKRIWCCWTNRSPGSTS
ncbi:MAG: hypothetical protein R2716_05505 [Microthrixaceae bacterium]